MPSAAFHASFLPPVLVFCAAAVLAAEFPSARLHARAYDPIQAIDLLNLAVDYHWIQKAEGIMGGADLIRGSRLLPEPLTPPEARSHGLSPETRDIIGEDGAGS